ncbi:MAG: hypothetical protein ACKPH3_25785 [Dolichospermum sp.]
MLSYSLSSANGNGKFSSSLSSQLVTDKQLSTRIILIAARHEVINWHILLRTAL